MATRPTILPTWATSGSAEVITPAPAKRVAGFISGEVIVTEFVNWLFYYLWTWISYLDAGAPYTSLTTAFDTLAAGSVASVYEDDSQTTTVYSASTGAQVGGLATDGRYIVWATAAGHPLVQSRDTPGTTIRTLTRSGAGTNHAITMAGDLCAVAYANAVELFRVSTGASLWVYDHGAQVNDVAIYDTSVYLCGVASGGVTLRQIAQNTGFALVNYNHGATMQSVWADQGGVYAGGAVSGGFHLRAFSSALAVVWSVALPASIDTPGCIRGDDVRLYVASYTGDVYRVERADGSVLSTFTVPVGWATVGLDVDHGGVWAALLEIATGSGLTYKLSKDLSFVASATASETPAGVASDGGRIWTWGTPTGANPGLRSSQRLNRPGQYFRRDTTTTLGTTRIRWRYHRKNLSPAGEEC